MNIDDFDITHNDADTIFKDVITLILLGITILFVIALFHINPVKEAEKDDKTLTPPGSMSVYIVWDADLDHDVDLWIKAPKDSVAMGFSNKDSGSFNLLKDDIGFYNNEAKPLNFENAFSRELQEGEYIINVHMYDDKRMGLPISVEVTVRIENKKMPSSIWTKTKLVNLERINEEKTVFRFRLDKNGIPLESTLNDIPISIRIPSISIPVTED